MGQWRMPVRRGAHAVACPLFLLPHSYTVVTMLHVHSIQMDLQWGQTHPVFPERLSEHRDWQTLEAVHYILIKILWTQGRQWNCEKHERPRNLSYLSLLIYGPILANCLPWKWWHRRKERATDGSFSFQSLVTKHWGESRNQGRKYTCWGKIKTVELVLCSISMA